MDQPKPSSEDAEAKEYVAEIMRRHSEDARQPTRPPRRRRGPRPAIVAGLAAAFLALVGVNVYLAGHEPEVVSPAQEEASARLTVYLVAQSIQAYRNSARTLPHSLVALGVDGPGITYAPTDTAYTLTVEIGATRLTYRSGESLESYRAAAAMLAGGLR